MTDATLSDGELNTRAKEGVLWTLGGNLVRQLVMFTISLTLARLLDPADYGLIGTVLVFSAFLTSLHEAGLAQAVVYQRDVQQLPAFLGLAVYLGAAFMVVMILAAGPLARFYALPQLEPVMRWMSIALLLDSLRAVLSAQMNTAFQFRSSTVVEGLSALASGLATLFLAWQGWGVWSLVVNAIVAPTLQVIAYAWLLKARLTLWPARDWSIATLRWGLPLTGASLLWKFYDNADFFVVGKLMGPRQLGQYTMAFRLATMVNDYLGVALSRVSLPTFSALKDQKNQAVVERWLQFTRASALISVPVLCGIGCASEDFLRVVLGPKWLPAVLPLRLLTAVGLLRIVTPLVNNMLVSIGHRKTVFQFNLLCALTLPVAFYAGCRWDGLRGVGLTWMLLLPVLSFWLVRRALRLADLTWAPLWNAVADAFLAGVLLLSILLPILWLLPSGLVRFLWLAAGGLTGLLLCAYWIPGYIQLRRMAGLGGRS